MKENLRRECVRERVLSNTTMEMFMRDSGRTIRRMVMESIPLKMDLFMREILKRGRGMERESL